MNDAREFHIGDILSVTTGRLVSPDHIDGIYKILNWMSGESLMTHQLPRVSRECEGPLLLQHPDLAAVVVPDDLKDEVGVLGWLESLYPAYGRTRLVTPLASGEHVAIPPVMELEMLGTVTVVEDDTTGVTLSLAELIAALDDLDPDMLVRFADGRLPDAFGSWRGVYAELALNYRREMPSKHAKPPTVGWLLGLARAAVYETFNGYKGGSFEMGPGTQVWVDNYGEYTGEELASCREVDGVAVLTTRRPVDVFA
jgi:hypothetical protein